MDFINGLVVLMNFVLIPATAYGAQLTDSEIAALAAYVVEATR